MRTLLTLLIVSLIAVPAFAADLPATQSEFVEDNAKLELLFDGCCVLSEGVAVAPDGRVFFSDITFSHKCADETGGIQAGKRSRRPSSVPPAECRTD
jgi:hypothetical protein